MILPEPSVYSLLVAKHSIGLMGKCGGDFNESNASEYQAGGKTGDIPNGTAPKCDEQGSFIDPFLYKVIAQILQNLKAFTCFSLWKEIQFRVWKLFNEFA